MRKTATSPDEPDPRPTATAPVGAVLPPGAAIRDCHEGLRGFRARRDSLLAQAVRVDIDHAEHRPRRSVLGEIGEGA
jgi:hypothetical protein